MRKGLNIVLLGPPGAGKSAQGELLAKRFKLDHIKVGDILRREEHRHTWLGRHITKIMNSGNLIGHRMVVHVVKKHLRGRTHNILFDGFPRTMKEARWLSRHLKIDLVILLSAPHTVLIDRLKNRRVCLSGEVYNVSHTSFKKMKCRDGSLPFQRDDDKPKAIRHRLEVYQKQTLPVKDFFVKRAVVRIVSAEGSIRKVFLSVKKCVEEYNG